MTNSQDSQPLSRAERTLQALDKATVKLPGHRYHSSPKPAPTAAKPISTPRCQSQP